MTELRRTRLEGKVDSGNSTTTPLGISGNFPGAWVNILDYGIIFVNVYSDKASATNGLVIQQSSDGVNVDHTDEYTVPAATGKNYAINPHAKYARVVYTNGLTAQTEFRLQTILKGNSKPTSHKVNNDITGEDDSELVSAAIKISGGDPSVLKPASVQYPLPTDGDSIYVKDIDVDNSDNGGFTGSVTDYFDSLITVNTDSSATNPKIITICFRRSLQFFSIGLGCDDITKNFSNVKVSILGSAGAVRHVVDESTNSTKYNSRVYSITSNAVTVGGNKLKIEFYTADAVSLSNIIVFKSVNVNSKLQAVQPAGTAITIGATDSGNLKVTDAENGLAIAKGDVEGTTFIHKFGNAPDFDIADGFVTVWDGADDGGINEMQYNYSTSADIDSISSSNNGDTQDIEILGLDTNYELVTQTITLTGQTRKAIDTNLIRVFRLKNVSSTDLAGTVYCYVNTALAAGVPIDTTKIRALVVIGNNQTLMTVYTIPAGTTGYMRDWFAAISGAKKDSVHVVKIFARPFGQVFQLKHQASIIAAGTSTVQHRYEEPEVFTEKTDIEIKVNSDADQAEVSAGFDLVIIDN